MDASYEELEWAWKDQKQRIATLEQELAAAREVTKFVDGLAKDLGRQNTGLTEKQDALRAKLRGWADEVELNYYEAALEMRQAAGGEG